MSDVLLEQIKQVIVDGQAHHFKDASKRTLQISVIPGKATICIGVRRCGKSTYMDHIMQNLIKDGIDRKNILHLDFFDDRLHALHHNDLDLVIKAYFSLYPNKKNSEKIYCFFDEIQEIKNWELFINRIMRTEDCQIYITGSSAKMLSKEIATAMRGRALSWEMFPYSFLEFLTAREIIYDRKKKKNKLLAANEFNAFMEIGGFPEVTNLTRQLRIKTHQEYFNTLIFRDLIERHDIANPKSVIDLAHFLIENIASKHSINRMHGYLQALQHKVSKNTIGQYLAWFEDAYFLFQVFIYDASIKRAQANDKKIYCIDHSLVRSIASGILVNSGHLLENVIFTALRNITEKIYYYRTTKSKEVDFMVLLANGAKMLVQVCESMHEQKTYDREIAALTEAMQELKLQTSIIVTKSEEKLLGVVSGEIRVMTAWQFMLELEYLKEP
mgnify:FL=1